MRSYFRSRSIVATAGAIALSALLLRAQETRCPACPPALDTMPAGVDRGAGGLSRWLRALRTRASIMMITAHPDDEDGGMLAYETRGLGARGILLTLNRGEGGQNAMSPDLYDAMGLVRTQELLAADRYYGVDQYWTRAIDYGFSKTREEALEKWGHDRVLADVVRVVRMTRPLVITAVFAGAPTDGHGQHQLSGQMAQEAYTAAGDPTKFPEQIREGLRPWTPLKVYARVPFFDVTPKGMYDYATDKFVPVRFFDYVNQKWADTKPAESLRIEEGSYAPVTGLTYLQIGREGLGLQKSQNGGMSIPPPGPLAAPYHRYASRVPVAEHEESFFDGIEASVAGIGSLVPTEPDFLKRGLADISKMADDAYNHYTAERPEDIAPMLATGLHATRSLIDQVRASNLADPGKSDVIFELCAKEHQFEQALIAALGLSLQATVSPDKEPSGPFAAFRGAGPTFTIAIPGQSFGVQVRLVNESARELKIEGVGLQATDGKPWQIAVNGETAKLVASKRDAQVRFKVTAPANAALTRPYFTRPDEEQAYFDLSDERYRNLSNAPYPLTASVTVSYRDEKLALTQTVQTLTRVQGLGIEYDPLIIGPAISVSVAPAAGAVPVGARSFAFSCALHSNVKGPAQGTLRLRLPEGWKASPEAVPFEMDRDGADQKASFTVFPASVTPREYRIIAVAEYQGRSYEEGYRLVGYPGLRPYPFYRPAIYRAVGVDVKTAPGLRVAFLPGTGDDVPQALENLEQNVRILSERDVTEADLSGYDAIILGVRAYAVRSELKSANRRLLDYVKGGGVLIVQYNLQDFDRNYGPYPFTLGDNPQKVVDESSKVRLLEPGNPVFTWPNKITEADFSGWVEERGHGFLKSWDSHYVPLLETNDPDQDPQLGGLLLARYGKGAYIYDAFALYRQLPSGVPGAYRILANLVSLSKNPGWITK
jgi:LmbE family N-acetylglucosaminyl deacetylase